jgi:hypothetical protein
MIRAAAGSPSIRQIRQCAPAGGVALGWQELLTLLAKLVEAEIPD